MELTAADICRATGGRMTGGGEGRVIRSVTIDSRAAGPDALFVPLQGLRADGHEFIDAAFAAGAAAALARRGHPSLQAVRSRGLLIEVEEPLRALGDIAGCWRTRCPAAVVGITGSNGKTSTKEMAWSIVSRSRSCLRNPGNFNNLIGLPLSLCTLEPGHEAALFEMGMSEPGEIRRLCNISKPRVGLITNIGPSHLQQLKTLDAVAAAKAELFESLLRDGTAIVNLDDPRTAALAARTRAAVLTFGIAGGDITAGGTGKANGSGTEFELSTGGSAAPVRLRVPGVHFVSNALAAAAVAHALGIGIRDIAAGLEAFSGVPGRMETLFIGGARIINDAYNANPASMQHALQVLAGLADARRRIAVLGDMLELGERSGEFHRALGRSVAALPIEYLLVAGGFAAATGDGARAAGMPSDRILHGDDAEALGAALANLLRAGDAVLVKGSRGMRMERVIDALRPSDGGGANVQTE